MAHELGAHGVMVTPTKEASPQSDDSLVRTYVLYVCMYSTYSTNVNQFKIKTTRFSRTHDVLPTGWVGRENAVLEASQ